ncbi:MAG: hypothetical protein ACK40D_14520, partial [Cyanobacteriota bacterium]
PPSVPTPLAFSPVPPTTSSPSVELLMDVANTTQEITSRLTARAFSAIAHPEQGPALREVMRELLFLLDETAEGPGC